MIVTVLPEGEWYPLDFTTGSCHRQALRTGLPKDSLSDGAVPRSFISNVSRPDGRQQARADALERLQVSASADT